MDSNYFEKIQKRYDELAKEGYGLVSGQKFYQSLLKELPNVPDDTYCTHEFMFRIHESLSVKKDQSFKTISYRLYDDETFEWSEWRDNDFNTIDDMTRTILDSSPSVYWKDKDDVERVDFMWDVVLKDKKIYILNMAVGEKSYVPSRQLVLYAPELLQKKYVRKSDKKEVGGDIFPWLFIQVGRPALRYADTPVGAEIFSLHTRETTEESRHSFAQLLVHGFPEIYDDKKSGTAARKQTVKEIEDDLAKGVLPAEIVNAQVHINYDGAMFTPAQGLQYAQKRIEEFEKRLNEINPEFLRLKEILNMSPEEKEKFLQEEKKKEAQVKKEKAAQRAAKKAEQEAMDKKKTIIRDVTLALWMITPMLCAGVLLLLEVDSNFEGYLICAAIIAIVVVAWKNIKKMLKRKWGIKDDE